MTDRIYLDNHATTRVDPRVVEAMLPFWTEIYGNPASTSHAFGWEAKDAVDDARTRIAAAIGASPREIVFTSGATESNNLAIRGVAERSRRRGNHLVSVSTEHKAVLDPLARLARRGFDVTILGVEPARSPQAGRLDPGDVGRGAARRHVACLGDAGQQRNRRHPAAGRNRPDLPRSRGFAPLRRHASRGPNAGRRRGARRRPAQLFRTQTLWPQRRRRVVRAARFGSGPARLPDCRRRPRARFAQRHSERPGNRRLCPRPGSLPGRNAERSGPPGRTAQPAFRGPDSRRWTA